MDVSEPSQPSDAPGTPQLPTYRTRDRTRGQLPDAVDVAIIGAGTGGLTAGAYLSQAGYRVAVFDSHYVAGGCATCFHRTTSDGTYLFDVGLHYVGQGGAGDWLPHLLNEVGIEQEFLPLDPDGYDILCFPDFQFPIPAGLNRFRDRMVEYFPEERAGIDRYVTFVRHAGVLREAMVRSEFRPGVGDSLSMLFKGWRAILKQNATLGAIIDSCTSNPKLKAVMAGQQGDYALPPSEVAALFHAGLHQHFERGGYYPRGGGQAISDKLAETIEANGGSVHLRQGVESLLVENGKVVGLKTQGQQRNPGHEVRAKAVLSNADIQQTLLELLGPEHLPNNVAKRISDWEWPAGIFVTFLGVKADLKALGMNNANYWQFDSYDYDGEYDASRRLGPLPTRGAYITSASLKDPHNPVAPEGVSTLEVMSLVPGTSRDWSVDGPGVDRWRYRKNQSYQELKSEVEGQLIDRVDTLFPGLKESIVFAESATPISHRRYTRSIAGTGYGIAVTPSQFSFNRMDARAPVPNLYLCGASTRHGMGIIGTALSGRQAARFIARDLGRGLGLDRLPKP
ncbi:MAG TPA: NAD(P)/FAD-dependent oxidoreductase [Deltaproteobacteria bacterium]|nr:FAD-dependent oxidoreductase [Deltaproteobacteria bacterium]HCP47749.1 NAD(P)/FAD-dependent oxidoreductase [Deltaproteobacteria bacterium]